MPRTTPLQHALTGVDVALEAARFHARFGTCDMTRRPQPLSSRRKKPRKPNPLNSYTSSSLRPHVLAAERLSAWATPVTLSFHNSLTQALPVSDARALLEVCKIADSDEHR